jgi:hypothetical protein
MYPHFLVIGAQKAGTTWLDRNLRTHPQIWLPPEKEIHFFDLPRPLPFAALLFAPQRAARHWAKSRLERDWAKVRAGKQSLGWYLRYYFRPRNNRWYTSLFQPAADQICGECTPRYAILPESGIARIRELMPNSKIIYLLRDPIDRMWSDLAMFQGPRFGGKGLRQADDNAIDYFLTNPQNLAHSRYASNLERWEKFYPASRIFMGYQEEICQCPENLLRRLYEFLGVAPDLPATTARAHERINSKSYPAPHRDLAQRLAGCLLEDTGRLHRKFGSNHTAAWLDRNRRLSDPSASIAAA